MLITSDGLARPFVSTRISSISLFFSSRLSSVMMRSSLRNANAVKIKLTYLAAQQIQPLGISKKSSIKFPSASFIKEFSRPIFFENSFCITATFFSSFGAFKMLSINVVFPEPRNPDTTMTLVFFKGYSSRIGSGVSLATCPTFVSTRSGTSSSVCYFTLFPSSSDLPFSLSEMSLDNSTIDGLNYNY